MLVEEIQSSKLSITPNEEGDADQEDGNHRSYTIGQIAGPHSKQEALAGMIPPPPWQPAIQVQVASHTAHQEDDEQEKIMPCEKVDPSPGKPLSRLVSLLVFVSRLRAKFFYGVAAPACSRSSCSRRRECADWCGSRRRRFSFVGCWGLGRRWNRRRNSTAISARMASVTPSLGRFSAGENAADVFEDGGSPGFSCWLSLGSQQSHAKSKRRRG